jgi:hypothetical protein
MQLGVRHEAQPADIFDLRTNAFGSAAGEQDANRWVVAMQQRGKFINEPLDCKSVGAEAKRAYEQ